MALTVLTANPSLPTHGPMFPMPVPGGKDTRPPESLLPVLGSPVGLPQSPLLSLLQEACFPLCFLPTLPS